MARHSSFIIGADYEILEAKTLNNLATKLQTTPLQTDDDKRWQAALARDRSFDGQFVFAVRSTGIYCRPSCPSRRPRRDRVTFFGLPEAAQQAGFRACRRCNPKQTETTDPQIEMIQKACRFIESHHDEPASLDLLSEQLGLSSFHLQRTFKSIMGITPREYAEVCRTNRFRSNVRSGQSVTAAMYDAGYGSSSRLYERANAELGMTPAAYSRAGDKTNITYTIVQTSLGYLLIAATEKGVCAVRLGDTAAALETGLRNEFSAAEIHRSDKGLEDAVAQIVKHLEGKKSHLDLPLDIRATAFQRLVWEALRAIPYGSTRSYSDIAKQIGQPKAVRAVARACATNPVALVIPCHRVVREDRSLGGYRWGIDRKKRLLEKEGESEARSGRNSKLPF
ncbi:MAG TPA: bifunctional DNA-binding transcriptional regulator/O6-methylguanine-DNA methyltransferase Ada [Pyrinomonadaceae bacterium]|nr:bifunctional DNA-binding transcriptional regulator/O6-methylguanine-DNA methyltransferase Ada [Pyrinomonadaceae bacterium]